MDSEGSRFAGPVATPFTLAELVDYRTDAIVSRTLIDAGGTPMTLFALDGGERISEHSAPSRRAAPGRRG